MSTAAREVDIADAVAAIVRTSWNPTAPDGVQRVWVANVGLDPDDPTTLIQGRQVFVLPVTHATPERITRAELRNEYTIGVLIVERYPGEGDPPNDWIDARVLFAEQKVYRLLGNPDLEFSGQVVTKAIPALDTPPSVDVLVDRERFVENQTYLSQYTFVFQDLTDYTGN